MKRSVFLVGALLLFALACPVVMPMRVTASPGGCETTCGGPGVNVTPDDSGIGIHLGAGGGSARPPSGGSSAPATGIASLVEYDYRPACSTACTLPGFVEADAACTGRGGEYYYVDSRPVGTQPWETGTDIVCLTPDQTLGYDPAQLAAYMNEYFQRLPLPTPGLKVAPSDNAVVNLPEIVSAEEPAQTRWVVEVAPFPRVVLDATVSWEWDFGDGTTLRTGSPGRPFDPGDPNIDGYLTHTYTQAKDAYEVSVTAVWTATYTVAGQGGGFAVDGAVARTSTLRLRAADYASVLVGN